VSATETHGDLEVIGARTLSQALDVALT
jgi:hypothetical protein